MCDYFEQVTNNYDKCVEFGRFTCIACRWCGPTNDIKHMIDTSTVLCPYCGVDAVYPGTMSNQRLVDLNKQQFSCGTIDETLTKTSDVNGKMVSVVLTKKNDRYALLTSYYEDAKKSVIIN